MARTIKQPAWFVAATVVATFYAPMFRCRASADDLVNGDLRERSLGWYVLSQTDGIDLLHGLPQRLYQAAVSEKADEAAAASPHVTTELIVEYHGELEGDLHIGAFEEARFSTAPPVAVFKLPGPGRHEIRLPPGDWSLGAMVGLPPHVEALGVDQNWPRPVRIRQGESPTIRVLVSDRFRARPAGIPQLERGFNSFWGMVNPQNLIVVRTLDLNGDPYPFNRIAIVDRDARETRSFHEAGTDHLGCAYVDQVGQTFSVAAQRFRIDPEEFLFQWEYVKLSRLYDATDRPVIDVWWDEFPSGTGRIVGRVQDQNGRPLTEFFLTLTQQNGERKGWSNAQTIAWKKPVLDSDGRFEFDGLLPGEYTAMIRHFDYEKYEWNRDGPKFEIPEDAAAVVEVDWTVKERN